MSVEDGWLVPSMVSIPALGDGKAGAILRDVNAASLLVERLFVEPKGHSPLSVVLDFSSEQPHGTIIDSARGGAHQHVVLAAHPDAFAGSSGVRTFTAVTMLVALVQYLTVEGWDLPSLDLEPPRHPRQEGLATG